MNDLKAGNFAIVLNKSGFSQNQINATKNIYLLSERGYSKLLKMHSADYKKMFCNIDKSERKSLSYKASGD